MNKQDNKLIEILLVEDNLGDIRLTQEAFREGKIYNHMTVVMDGVEALAYLRKQGKYADAKKPDIILLDLNLPKKNGREVLAEIKEDPALKRIPVIVLTTSAAEEDVIASYDLHANCYIRKPVDFSHFITVVTSIENFWLSIVTIPKE